VGFLGGGGYFVRVSLLSFVRIGIGIGDVRVGGGSPPKEILLVRHITALICMRLKNMKSKKYPSF